MQSEITKKYLSSPRVKELYRKLKRNWALKKRFGIDLEQYSLMLEKQNYSCAICNKHRLNFKQDFSVDHNHLTGEIRSLLCVKCNTIIGLANDDKSLLLKCIDYLK